ncbi:NAD(P)/FAD-dependent oxidoreductase [Domibacillus antri]|uniref:NAD(P)/FAD-dependent oxidoreductase n=1 Tax=Domibacillus antri TaxID=1714264 RepID=UPI001FE9A4BD|nr:NAD(P)/FAD-dependent oxidoreductase [Domibacillus antri]
MDGEPATMTDSTIDLKDGSQLEAKTVILATGFQPALPAQSWLEKLIMEQKLNCAKCGYPIVNESLEWCPHLFMAGPLAELEIGPIARNISGVRHAAERIATSL